MNERKIHIIYWKWKCEIQKHGNNKIKEKGMHDQQNEG